MHFSFTNHIAISCLSFSSVMEFKVVEQFPDLGIAAAAEFLRFVSKNPTGVVSLPSGKTPEFFIRWLQKLKTDWHDLTELRAKHGLAEFDKFPDTADLTFVQMDDFLPFNENAINRSFSRYVKRFYLEPLGIKKFLLIDWNDIAEEVRGELVRQGLSGAPLGDVEFWNFIFPGKLADFTLRQREPETQSERSQKIAIAVIDRFCDHYESAIRSIGGIGFFLGGLGPEGHVAFNCTGDSSRYSTTRFTACNYPTTAAAATDIGGLSRSPDGRIVPLLVITIGLGTINFNRHCEILILVAGEAKAKIAIESWKATGNSVGDPAISVLKSVAKVRLFLTMGASKFFTARSIAEQIARWFMSRGLPLHEWQKIHEEFSKTRLTDQGAPYGFYGDDLGAMSSIISGLITRKIHRGSLIHLTDDGLVHFLHIEPHHDDVLLGYLPLLLRLPREDVFHSFVTLTSGFNSVSDSMLSSLRDHIAREGKCDAVTEFIAADGDEERKINAARRNFQEKLSGNNQTTAEMKSWIREFESETLWRSFGFSDFQHLRLPFYTADIFAPAVGQEDVSRVEEVIDDIAKTIIQRSKKESFTPTKEPTLIMTVALDPESSGPDTHYKCLQAVSRALDSAKVKFGNTVNFKIWAYRNVWTTFSPIEATVMIPITIHEIATMKSAFMNFFTSQKNAEFPSPNFNGPFSGLVSRIWRQNLEIVRSLLGPHLSKKALPDSAAGLIFMREMKIEHLHEYCAAVRCAAEGGKT